MIALTLDKGILKVLTIFALSPGSKISRDELKKKTKMHNVDLDQALTILSNAKILQKGGRFWGVSFDEAKKILPMVTEAIKELREIPLGAYFSILSLLYVLMKKRRIEVFLFGSYAKLIYKESSDIDIAIVSSAFKPAERRKIAIQVQKIESRFHKKIEIHYFEPDIYKHKKDPLVQEVLRNGMRLI